MKSSYIVLENIQIFAHHGVMEQEAKVGNHFSVSVKLKVDLTKASETDNVDDTISYADIYNIIKEEMQQPSKLLEHVAGRIVSHLKMEFPSIEEIEIKLSKLNPPMGAQLDAASVILID